MVALHANCSAQAQDSKNHIIQRYVRDAQPRQRKFERDLNIHYEADRLKSSTYTNEWLKRKEREYYVNYFA